MRTSFPRSMNDRILSLLKLAKSFFFFFCWLAKKKRKEKGGGKDVQGRCTVSFGREDNELVTSELSNVHEVGLGVVREGELEVEATLCV